MHDFMRRIRYLLHRRRFDRELANDLEFHREMAERAAPPEKSQGYNHIVIGRNSTNVGGLAHP